MTTLLERLRRSAERFPDYPAVITEERTITFSGFNALSNRVAAALQERGIVTGDRVALYCPNSADFAIAYAGIVKAGAAVVPVNVLLKPREISLILNDAGASALIYHSDFEDCAGSLRQTVSSLKFSTCIAREKEGVVPWNDFLTSAGSVPSPKLGADDLAAILYTSGTTGRPKGAMLSHGNLVANTESVRQALQWEAGRDVVLLVLPMFHAFAATVGMLTPLTGGCAFVPLPKFDPEQVARSVRMTGATVFLGVPSMYTVLLKLKPDRVAMFQSLRYCVSGGAALPTEILQRFQAVFGKLIYEGDGPTECSPVTCVNPIGGTIKPGSVGIPVPSVEMKIVDDHGRDLPPGEVGEIAVSGPNVMKGYWNLPRETAECFRGEWFLTGDLGVKDAEGYFSIVDRKKDLVIVNGMNVYPRIIEETLYCFSPIREAAVVGEAHGLHGEIPVAYVSIHEGKTASETEIRNYCRERLGRHEVPRKIYIVPELPKNASGKILKRELRKRGEIERGVNDGFLRPG
ncbi:MAG: long-chain fatty acid--CoA ligase [Pseudomonadota bacterium]